jgi:hypothetical protein
VLIDHFTDIDLAIKKRENIRFDVLQNIKEKVSLILWGEAQS